MAKVKMTEEQREISVVENMAAARELASKTFGSQVTTEAIHEIYDYHAVADTKVFAEDLQRVYAYAKKAYSTEAPTPAQVFGLFERIFGEDE